MTKKKQTHQEGLKIKGMFRLQIEESGKIVGDSGWFENQVTNLGFNNIVNQLGTSLTGSKLSHAALGTGGAPAASDTSLSGEIAETSGRASLVAATSSSSKTLRNTATFSSGTQITTTHSISNIGLFSTSTQGGGTLFAGNTYTSSSVASNQNVNITYDIIFS